MEPLASTLYDARLRVRSWMPRPLLLPLVFIRNAVLGALGIFGDSVAPACVEVFRRSDGFVLGEVAAGGSYSEQADLLGDVRRDLAAQPAGEFLARWHLHDA